MTSERPKRKTKLKSERFTPIKIDSKNVLLLKEQQPDKFRKNQIKLNKQLQSDGGESVDLSENRELFKSAFLEYISSSRLQPGVYNFQEVAKQFITDLYPDISRSSQSFANWFHVLHGVLDLKNYSKELYLYVKKGDQKLLVTKIGYTKDDKVLFECKLASTGDHPENSNLTPLSVSMSLFEYYSPEKFIYSILKDEIIEEFDSNPENFTFIKSEVRQA
jgi:hypothetical protein